MLPTLFYYTQLWFPGRAQFLVIQGRVRGKPAHRQFVFLESMHVYKWGQLRDRANLCWGNNGKTTPLKIFRDLRLTRGQSLRLMNRNKADLIVLEPVHVAISCFEYTLSQLLNKNHKTQP